MSTPVRYHGLEARPKEGAYALSFSEENYNEKTISVCSIYSHPVSAVRLYPE